jgi:hypothetical protein
MAKKLEVYVDNKLVHDFTAKMMEEGFIKNNGKPAISECIRHLIRSFTYKDQNVCSNNSSNV